MRRAGLRFCGSVLALLCGCAAPQLRPGSEGLLGEGMASFYGPGLYGRRTASGLLLTPSTRVAAHRWLPFGTCLTVQRVGTDLATQVEVADRGPFMASRVLDLSEAAAADLGMRRQGVVQVRFWRCR